MCMVDTKVEASVENPGVTLTEVGKQDWISFVQYLLAQKICRPLSLVSKPHLCSSCVFSKYQEVEAYHVLEILTAGHRVSIGGPMQCYLLSWAETGGRGWQSIFILITSVITATGELAPSDCSYGCWGWYKAGFKIEIFFLSPCHLHPIAFLNKTSRSTAEQWTAWWVNIGVSGKNEECGVFFILWIKQVKRGGHVQGWHQRIINIFLSLSSLWFKELVMSESWKSRQNCWPYLAMRSCIG